MINVGAGGTALRIGFICHEYPTLVPSHGGIGTVTQTLAHHLAMHGHDVQIYSPSTIDGEFMDGDVRVRTRQCRGALRTMRLIRTWLTHELANGTIDVIESPECTAHWLPGGLGSVIRMNGSHHFWCATLPQRRRPTRLFLEQLGIRRAAGLAAVSQFAADVTRQAMRLGRRSITILPNPVDTTLFHPTTAPIHRHRIVFAGSIVEKKGIRELCRSMKLLCASFPEVELHVAGRDCPAPDGSASFRAQLEAELDAGLRDKIHFLGPIPRADVSRLFATAEACVFPSHMETQGIVVTEAMACGRPVVVSQRGPGPELINETPACGLLIDPFSPADIAKAIGQILSDPTTARTMGNAARQRALRHFSVTSSINSNLEFYRRWAVR